MDEQHKYTCMQSRWSRELTVRSYFEIIIRVRQVGSQEGLAGRIGDIFIWQPFFQTQLLASSELSALGLFFAPYHLLRECRPLERVRHFPLLCDFMAFTFSGLTHLR